MTYQRVILDETSLPYVREVLMSGNTLARQLAEFRNLESGSVFAFLPSEMRPSAITDYRYANDTGRVESLDCLTQFISHFLHKNQERMCLLENRYARESDPVVVEYRSRILCFNEEVYHTVGGSQTSHETIRTAIIEADTSLSLVGVCFSRTDQCLWSSKSDLSLADIEIVVKNADYIIVEAFDGGGFLIWSQSSREVLTSTELPHAATA